VQKNGRYGIYRGELRATTGDNIDHREEIRFSTSGAITYVGGYLRPTRPVTDSFSLVKVSDLEDVRVYLNSQDMGRTDKDGILVIPTMSSYFDNQISIEDKDIPIDYLMPRVSQNLSPPLRSGSCSYFPVEKYQAYMGRLVGQAGEGTAPLEYFEGSLRAGDRTVTFFTGSGGEFYFDNDPANMPEQTVSEDSAGCASIMATEGFVFATERYRGSARNEEGVVCAFEVALNPTQETYVDLGEVVCQTGASSPLKGTAGSQGGTENPVPDALEKDVSATNGNVEADLTGQGGHDEE
jgi:outer membrane usher protein